MASVFWLQSKEKPQSRKNTATELMLCLRAEGTNTSIRGKCGLPGFDSDLPPNPKVKAN